MSTIAIIALLAILIVALIVIAVVWLGVDRFAAAWDRIPKSWRTIINVAVGAVFAYLVSYAAAHVADWNLPPEAKVLLIGIFTAIFRALNPGDSNPQTLSKQTVQVSLSPGQSDTQDGQ